MSWDDPDVRVILRIVLALVTAGCTPAPEAQMHGSATASEMGATAAVPVARAPAVDPMRLRAADIAWVDSTLAALTLRQKAAQVVMPWISGAAPVDNPGEVTRMLRWVEREEVGGLIVSTGTPSAIAAKLARAQARARIPLLIASDLETGPGMRLRPGGTDIPPAMAIGAADSETLARAAGVVTGLEARAVGIHLTLGPVLDVNSNPANPIINIRSFGEEPERVGRLASAWIAGARDAGLQTVGKHFPGHGDTEVDSHLGLAAIHGDAERLARVELAPFRSAMRAGMDGVLVGHIAVPAIDGPDAGPASISPRVTRDLLRREMGFDGLVVTDALNMGAITGSYSVPEASVRALRAGADLLLQPPGTESVISAIVAAVESGRLARERLDDAVRRVLRAKARAGLHRGGVDTPDRGVVGQPAHREVAERVAREAITLVRDRSGLVPLSRDLASVLHIRYSDTGQGSTGNVLSETLLAAGYAVDQARIGAGAGQREVDALRERARRSDLVLVSVTIAPYQYRELGLRGSFPTLVEELAASGKAVVAVSFGSPYLLDSFPSIPTYLLAWSGSGASQRAAANALMGLTPISGRLPVSLPPFHAAGADLGRGGSGD